MVYVKQHPESSNDALHLPNLDIQGKDLTICIEFAISNSSLPKANTKIKPPDTLIELYGNTVDVSVSPQMLKD